MNYCSRFNNVDFIFKTRKGLSLTNFCFHSLKINKKLYLENNRRFSVSSESFSKRMPNFSMVFKSKVGVNGRWILPEFVDELRPSLHCWANWDNKWNHVSLLNCFKNWRRDFESVQRRRRRSMVSNTTKQSKGRERNVDRRDLTSFVMWGRF